MNRAETYSKILTDDVGSSVPISTTVRGEGCGNLDRPRLGGVPAQEKNTSALVRDTDIADLKYGTDPNPTLIWCSGVPLDGPWGLAFRSEADAERYPWALRSKQDVGSAQHVGHFTKTRWTVTPRRCCLT